MSLVPLRESLDAVPPTPAEGQELLSALRWHADMVVTNYSGDRVWLKTCMVDGVQHGITDCCFEDEPCPHHAAIAAKEKA